MGIKEYIPDIEIEPGVFVNEMNTILMAETIEKLGYQTALNGSKKYLEMDCDILDVKYPHYIRLQEALKLRDPKAFYYAKDLPLFVEFEDKAYMIAPAVESMDDVNAAIETLLYKDMKV